MQLWWIALNGGEAEPLTNMPGGIRFFKWSPDGKFIAFIRTDTDTPEERARKAAKNDQNLIDRDYHYDRLWIYDLAAHQARLLTTQKSNVDAIDWSPDGSLIVARVSPTPRIDDYWRVSKVVLFDTRSGAITRTIEEHSGYTSPTFSHDGTAGRLLALYPAAASPDDITSSRTSPMAAHPPRRQTARHRRSHAVDRSRQSSLVSEYVHAHTESVEMDTFPLPSNRSPAFPSTRDDFHANLDGQTVIFLGDTPAMPAEVYIWKNGHAEAVTCTNPQVAQWNLGTQREISWQESARSSHHLRRRRPAARLSTRRALQNHRPCARWSGRGLDRRLQRQLV